MVVDHHKYVCYFLKYIQVYKMLQLQKWQAKNITLILVDSYPVAAHILILQW